MTAAAFDALPETIEDDMGLELDPDVAMLYKEASLEEEHQQLPFMEVLHVSQLAVLAEKKMIWLPSSIGIEKCIWFKLAEMVAIEQALRESQANDVLHDIRIMIAEKSFAFWKKIMSLKE